MPRGQYIVLTLIGSTVWNALLISAGYALGSQWERVSDAIGRLSTPLLILTGLAVAALVVRRVVRARRRYDAAGVHPSDADPIMSLDERASRSSVRDT